MPATQQTPNPPIPIMLLTVLAAAVLAAPAPPVAPALAPLAVTTVEGHGKLHWFDGSYEEALTEAAASDKLVFIDFWTDW